MMWRFLRAVLRDNIQTRGLIMAVFDDLNTKIEEVRTVSQHAVEVLTDLRNQLATGATGGATEEQVRSAISSIDAAIAPLRDATAPPPTT
jgi:hypothetical protein